MLLGVSLLYFVSTNKHKFYEIRRVLARHGIKLLWLNLELVEPQSESLEDIAIAKAEHAYKKVMAPLIVEDTGVFFEGFTNFPGTQAKRVYERIGFEGLLKLAAKKSGRAYFKTAICYKDEKRCKIFSGTLRGRIARRVYCANKDVMPYEKIFIPYGKKRPLCMISRKEKSSFSHRAIASEKLARWLKSHVFKTKKA